MMTWIRNNKTVSGMIVITALCAICLMFAQGCDIQKYIVVDAPPAIYQATQVDVPDGHLTLANAQNAWSDWQHYVDTNTERFKIAVDDANNRYNFYSSLINTGLGIGEGAIGQFPAGALILSLLTGGTGLLMKRPNEDARVAAEKEASYNKGLEVGKTLALEIKKDNIPT